MLVENATNGDATRAMMSAREEAKIEGRVSVVIPAYNVSAFLEKTLHSVFSQTVQPHEVIIVNDGSPDTAELEAVLAPFGERVRYIVQENRGASAARNRGVDVATGDDIWLPEYLATQIEFLHSHEAYDLVYCNAVFFGDSVYAGQEYMAVCPSTGEADSAALIASRCHVFISLMGRASALKAFRFDETLWSSEDFECWLRISAAGHKIGYHRKILVRYRRRPESLSANLTSMAQAKLRALTKSLALWPETSEEVSLLRSAIARKTAELETMRGKLALQANDAGAAIEHLERANLFYKSVKLRVVVALLRYAPALVRSVSSLRERRFRSYRGSN